MPMKPFWKFARRPSDDLSPEERDDRRGLIYAVSAHLLVFLLMLFGFLANAPRSPNPVQIELWAEGDRPDAAQPEEQPEEAPEEAPPQKPKVQPPPPEPTPQPEPKPEPPKPAPSVKPQPQPEPEIDPEIALEKARKEKAEKEKAARLAAEKAAAEKAEADKKAKEEAAKKAKAEADKKAKEEAARKAAAEKAEAEKKAKEEAAKKAAEQQAKEKAAKEAAEKAAAEKAAAEKKAKEAAEKKAAAEKAEAAKRDALKAAMRGDALGAAGIAGGTADRNQRGGGGSDNGYASQVRACVEPRVVYPIPPRTGPNPTVQYRATLDTTKGQVTHVEIRRSSGVPGFDRAVVAGIQACNPFPKPPNGKYPSSIEGNYQMYAQ